MYVLYLSMLLFVVSWDPIAPPNFEIELVLAILFGE
jgi:hypothetical protein